MVALDIVEQTNSRLKAANFPKVSVFVGGTSGIGQETITELVRMGFGTKLYLIGRPSAQERVQTHIAMLNELNPDAEIVWVSGEISLLRDVQRICTDIRSKESTIDLLFMSAGDLPFNGRTETNEGIDVSMSVQYYARVAFILNLLPLLRTSLNGRVISVKGGGMERTGLNVEDLGLKQPGSFGAIQVQLHIIAMNTLMLEKMAEQEKTITFIHASPGQVYTGNNMAAGVAENSPKGWLMRLLVRPLSTLIGFTPKESAKRNLFIITSALYGGQGVETDLPQAKNSKGETGRGLFILNQYCDVAANQKTLDHLRGMAQEKVWVHTSDIIKPFL